MRTIKILSIITLFIFITFGIVGGCGGDESLFGPSGEIRCKVALDDKDAFCGRSTNPGSCCHFMPCFFSGECVDCHDELPCCDKGEVLCSIVDICLDSFDQCPDSDQPLASEFITFNVGEVDCFPSSFSLILSGVVSGPDGTEWTVSIPERPELSLRFGVLLSCKSWTFKEGRCIRMEGDPVASDWVVSIDIFNIFEGPTQEVDFKIFTQDDSRTVTHIACPALL